MAKVFDFQWQIAVPEPLLRGAVFDRLDEVRFVILTVKRVKTQTRCMIFTDHCVGPGRAVGACVCVCVCVCPDNNF